MDHNFTELTVLDQESRVQPDDHLSLRLWLRLLTCTNLIQTQIRQQLRTEFDSTLPRFDLLAQLAREPSGLLMNALSKRLMVTGGNLTALANQLESEGLIARNAVQGDRRASRITLTAQGKRDFAAMAAQHEKWISNLFSALGRDEQRALHKLLHTLKKTPQS